MIRLAKSGTGEPIYISPEHIVEVRHDEDYAQTLVSTVVEGWYVAESPQEVVRKVLEWQYIMRKGAHTNTQEMARLRELAGLEEPSTQHSSHSGHLKTSTKSAILTSLFQDKFLP